MRKIPEKTSLINLKYRILSARSLSALSEQHMFQIKIITIDILFYDDKTIDRTIIES